MQSEPLAPSESETRENLGVENSVPGIVASSDDHVQAQQPAKKPTRKWAAWTRQEEESFFSALRHVGKNFEKITCRVQSKNKDQVRHYYYRLVRRMNKLLGPELCLDAKNSKDTNAAMLRWWSLLEKYSCNVSKLHLKPRRYKIFVDALENQLLKYRKKNDRKKPQGGYCSPSPSITSNHNRISQNDTRPVRLVLVDSQNTQKVPPGKPSTKNASSVGKTRSNTKADIASFKPPRRRQKSAVGSTAAYKKWEKEAIAGVCLVADAAEHLERSTVVKDIENEPPLKEAFVEGPSLQVISLTRLAENNLQSCMKLKLQLFPLDNTTRKALEMENHNPHLELTLSSRKKISSIVEHLNRKWGSSSVATGELVLFPFNTPNEKILVCQRWTQKSSVSAADVHAVVGSPEVFRLRYSWLCNCQSASGTLQACTQHSCVPKYGTETVDSINKQIEGSENNNQVQNNELMYPRSASPNSQPYSAHPAIGARKRRANSLLNEDIVESSEETGNSFFCAIEASDDVVIQQDTDEMRLSNSIPPSARAWADSLTDISIGGLLDASICHDIGDNCIPAPSAERPQCIPQSSFVCDSFDAAVAAHISRYQSKLPYESTFSSHEPSIWDAEETCDAFSFQRSMPIRKDGTTPSCTSSDNNEHQRITDPAGSIKAESRVMQDFTVNLPSGDDPPVDICMPDNADILDNPAPEALGLTDMDIYWPDSLGPLDRDLSSTKYHSEHFILSDSLSGLNRLLANSLDTFPNCSLFGMEKKEPSSTVEA